MRIVSLNALAAVVVAIALLRLSPHKTQPDEPIESDLRLVWWFAPFQSGGGYSSEAIAFLQALSPRVLLKIAQHGDAFNADFFYGLPTDVRDLMMTHAHKPALPETSIVVCHSEPGAWAPPLYQTSLCPPTSSTLYRIGRTMFETDRLTVGHVERCNRMDEVGRRGMHGTAGGGAPADYDEEQIWVPTQFHIDTFANSGVDRAKLYAIPEPVDVDFFNPDTAEQILLPSDLRDDAGDDGHLFRFLSVFKWEERKGWDLLLQAYLSEFSFDDDVILYLKTNPYHNTDSIRTRIEKFIADIEASVPQKPRARLVVLDRPIASQALPGLYAAVDAFVLPSRGEGWGRPHVEAMSMALPVIATNWSGPTEFMHDDNSYPLPIDGLVTINEGPFRQHQWAAPSVSELRRLMRHVVTHPGEAIDKGQRARADMVRLYSPAKVGDVVMRRLREINQDLDRKRPVPVLDLES